ncbi:hypothetical protein RB195_005841 [Necator americanus]|uniref:Uncharacterized protein n=1 Tax=Necator americanus TaxID=51031 RepID=A0ABR1BPV2_NECAM
MLIEFDETCRCIGLELSLRRTMFMRNGWISDGPFTLKGTNITCHRLRLSGSGNEHHELPDPRAEHEETSGLESIEDVVKKTKNTLLLTS